MQLPIILKSSRHRRFASIVFSSPRSGRPAGARFRSIEWCPSGATATREISDESVLAQAGRPGTSFARFDRSQTTAFRPRLKKQCATAFTLVELLVVIFIIVLLVTLALPAFNLISGSKSVAGAENEISSLLGRARADAVGVQDYRGLAIYRDAVTDRYAGAIVAPVVPNFASYPQWSGTSSYAQGFYVYYQPVANGTIYYYVSQAAISAPTSGTNAAPNTNPLQSNGSPYWCPCGPSTVTMDIQSNTDVEVFPTGVGVQVINNCTMSGTSRTSNGYLPIGVILFNGSGVMTLKNVALATYGNLGTIGSFSAYNSTNPVSIPYFLATNTSAGLPLSSSFGLVAYDKQSFDGQGFYSGLPSQLTYSTTSNNGADSNYSTAEQSADTWLDQNATPLLINRYNGTLVRSE